MEEKLSKLQQTMNDYLIKIHADESIIYENLNLFYSLACYIQKELFEHYNSEREPIDFSKISKISSNDKLKLIEEFHKKIGVEFDFDKFINDGTIGFMYYDYFNGNNDPDDMKLYNMVCGKNSYENSKKIVNIPNTGLITDVLIAIHEISHLRDQPDHRRNQTSDLLTEALAYAE